MKAIGVVTDAGADSPRDVVVQSTSYDATGRATNRTDALGRETAIEFDDADRPISIIRNDHTDLDGTVRDVVIQETTFDDGFPVRIETGDGQRVETHQFDAMGRLVTTTLDPGGLDRTGRSTFDRNGNLTSSSITDGTRSEVTRYTYDAGDRVTEMVVENGDDDLTTTYEYDERGALIREVDPRGNVPGVSADDVAVDYRYDEMARLIEVHRPQSKQAQMA